MSKVLFLLIFLRFRHAQLHEIDFGNRVEREASGQEPEEIDEVTEDVNDSCCEKYQNKYPYYFIKSDTVLSNDEVIAILSCLCEG
jgi:hypothetical protein